MTPTIDCLIYYFSFVETRKSILGSLDTAEDQRCLPLQTPRLSLCTLSFHHIVRHNSSIICTVPPFLIFQWQASTKSVENIRAMTIKRTNRSLDRRVPCSFIPVPNHGDAPQYRTRKKVNPRRHMFIGFVSILGGSPGRRRCPSSTEGARGGPW